MNKNTNEAAGTNSPASPASLETMLGLHNFDAQGRSYTLKPIKLKHIPEFKDKSNKVFIPGPENPDGFLQFIYLQDEAYLESVNKWLNRQLVFNEQPVTYEMVMEHDWDIDDIGRFLKEMVRVSG
jgi:hypothetical protein